MSRTTTTSGKRWYDWRGERYWSVTTILSGGVPKPVLLPWGIKMVAEGAVEAVEQELLVKMVEQDREGAVRYLKGLPYAHRDKAADIGTAVHEALEAYVLGKPFPKWSPLIVKRMRQVERFLGDYSPEYHMTEAPVFNRTERYAGTLDAVATIGGRKLVIDVKSGKAVYPEAALQLAAYRHAEFVGLPDGNEKPMPETEGAAVLHLTDEDYTLQHVESGLDVFKSFLYVREVFRWQEDLSKSAIGEALPLPGSESPESLDLAQAVNE